MTATRTPVPARSSPARRYRGFAAARLMRLELCHNAMLWMLPVVLALFWFVSYRKITAAPPIWEDEHIPGAVNLPYTKDLRAPVPLPREKTIVVYCACKDHEDSTDMARQLSLLGYRNVKVLKGGWFKWVDLKYKTISKEDEEKAAKR